MGPISPIQWICKRVGEKTGLVMGFLTVNRGTKPVRGGICTKSEVETKSEE